MNRITKLFYSTTTRVYPYSNSVTTITPPTPSSSSSSSSGPLPKSLLTTLNTHLTSLHPQATTYLPLFSRRSPNRIQPGSVLTITSYSSLPTPANPSPPTNSFSGVLIAIRRRHAGRDTSIRLRNMVGRTGVELAYKVFSPMIAGIKVIGRAETSGPVIPGKDGLGKERKKPVLRAARRAKLYFVREQKNRFVFFVCLFFFFRGSGVGDKEGKGEDIVC